MFSLNSRCWFFFLDVKNRKGRNCLYRVEFNLSFFIVLSIEGRVIYKKMCLCIVVFVCRDVYGQVCKCVWGIFETVWPKVIGVREFESESAVRTRKFWDWGLRTRKYVLSKNRIFHKVWPKGIRVRECEDMKQN